MINILLVAFGGGIGALMRYIISTYIQKKNKLKIPIHTMIINITGSFLLAYVLKNIKDSPLVLFLTTGFLGGFTTFSTLMIESQDLIYKDKKIYAYIYICLSLVLSILAFFLGVIV
nr:CrcB family protein [uncultured Peptostreptococcus sp.]